MASVVSAHLLQHGRKRLAAGDHAGAEAIAARLIGDGAQADAHLLLGEIRRAQGRLREALPHFAQAATLSPAVVDAHAGLGRTLSALGAHEQAVEVLMTALKLDPARAPLYNALGNSLAALGQYRASVMAFRRALRHAPDSVDAWSNMAASLLESASHDDALAAYRAALARAPDDAQVHSNLLFATNYLPRADAAALCEAHRAWARRHLSGITAARHRPDAGQVARRLRIGYMSNDFHRHPVSYHFEDVPAHHDRGAFEIFAYAWNRKQDDVTTRLRAATDHWRDVAGQAPARVAEQVARDRIDILIDLSGHTWQTQLAVLAHRPAPVQVSWMGYFNTTGLDTVDWLLTDAVASPEGDGQPFVERLWRLPVSRFGYRPPEYAPPVSALPAHRRGGLTFGCFNNLAKMTHDVKVLWARVLCAVPGSRLLLKSRPLADEDLCEALLADFESLGVSRARIELRGRSPHEQMLAEYGEVDIALDPFPFPGGLTTCEALWMGVPVLTLQGSTLIGRQGTAFLSAVGGLQDWIARDPDDYVSKAKRMAADLDALATLRAGLRARVRTSYLCDGARFTRDVELALRGMWTTWCTQPGG